MHTFSLRRALRTLFSTPFVTIVAIASLALGIGANAAIFSLFEQFLLRPLPVQEPDRLVNLAVPGPKPGSTSCNNACAGKARSRGTRCRDVIFETLFETLWVSNPIRPRSAASRNRVMRGPGVTQGAKRSQGARRPRN